MYIGIFTAVGLILVVAGRLPISRHREVKGTIARVIGGLLIVSSLLFVGILIGAPYVLERFDLDDDTIQTWSLMAAAIMQGTVLIYIALNLKKWSTVNQSTIARNDFTSLAEHDKGETNFGFLDAAPSNDDENASTS